MPTGRELSPREHKARLLDAIAQRSFYWRDEMRTDGRPHRRKRKTSGVHNLAVTLRPDHAVLLASLERDPRTSHLVRPFVLQLALNLAREFAAFTGLEVLTVECHPEEGKVVLLATGTGCRAGFP